MAWKLEGIELSLMDLDMSSSASFAYGLQPVGNVMVVKFCSATSRSSSKGMLQRPKGHDARRLSRNVMATRPSKLKKLSGIVEIGYV